MLHSRPICYSLELVHISSIFAGHLAKDIKCFVVIETIIKVLLLIRFSFQNQPLYIASMLYIKMVQISWEYH